MVGPSFPGRGWKWTRKRAAAASFQSLPSPPDGRWWTQGPTAAFSSGKRWVWWRNSAEVEITAGSPILWKSLLLKKITKEKSCNLKRFALPGIFASLALIRNKGKRTEKGQPLTMLETALLWGKPGANQIQSKANSFLCLTTAGAFQFLYGTIHSSNIVSRASLIVQLVKNLQEPQFDFWVRKICWRRDRLPTSVFLGFPCGSAGKESSCKARDLGSIPALGRSPGEGKGYPFQYSGLENSMNCE